MEKEIIMPVVGWSHEEYKALCEVVDYLHDDELKHYEEEITEGNYNKHHIWHSVKTLSLMLKEYQMKGEINE